MSSWLASTLLSTTMAMSAWGPGWVGAGPESNTGGGLAAETPKELEGIGIQPPPGAVLPDVKLRDQDGRTVSMRSYLGKPIILVLAYFECPMLCTLVLNGLKNGLRDLAWTAGQQFQVVTVSFDPRDSVDSALAKRKVYVGAYGRPVAEHGWDFLVGEQSEVKALADAVGFKYRWDDASKQFAHGTAAFVFTPDGRLSRTLQGIVFPERELRISLVEASEGKLGSGWDRLALLCYHYDPNARSYVLATKRLMQFGGVVTLMVVGAFLTVMWRRDRKRSTDEAASNDPLFSTNAAADGPNVKTSSLPPSAPRSPRAPSEIRP